MLDEERRKVENQLVVMGLNGLSDPDLIPVFAKMINEHPGFSNSHAFYLGFINECDESKRREMHDALKPYLKFDVWPLDKYVHMLKEHASNVASTWAPAEIGERKPIKIGGNEFEEVAAGDHDAVVVTLTCFKCTKKEDFMGLTPVEAVTVGRAVGWARDLFRQKEICPNCAPLADHEPRAPQSPDDEAKVKAAAEKRQRRAQKCLGGGKVN